MPAVLNVFVNPLDFSDVLVALGNIGYVEHQHGDNGQRRQNDQAT